MTKLEEEKIWNYFEDSKKIKKEILEPCCNLEMLTNIDESNYLSIGEKEKVKESENRLRNIYNDCSFDIYVLNSEEKNLCYLICVTNKDTLIGMEIDFKTKKRIFAINKKFYIKKRIKNNNMADSFVISIIGENISGKNKGLISMISITYIDYIETTQMAKEMANTLNLELKEKINSKKIKYSTTLQEVMINENAKKNIFYNKITDKEITIDTETLNLIEKYFSNEKELMDFFVKKTLKEKQELTKEEKNTLLSVINYISNSFDKENNEIFDELNILGRNDIIKN